MSERGTAGRARGIAPVGRCAAPGASATAGTHADATPARGAALGAFSFDCDPPPSTNQLYRNVPGRGRVVTREYQAWRDLAGRLGAPWPWYGDDKSNRQRWEITIAAHALSHRRDLDNLIKPTVDLVARQTGLRDAYCEAVTAFRSALEDGAPRVTVTVELWSEED